MFHYSARILLGPLLYRLDTVQASAMISDFRGEIPSDCSGSSVFPEVVDLAGPREAEVTQGDIDFGSRGCGTERLIGNSLNCSSPSAVWVPISGASGMAAGMVFVLEQH
jgi:hypothetical protein